MLDLKTLSADGSVFTKKLKEYFLTVGEGTVELTINLVVMVLVERFYDQQALGIYAYLLSLLFIISYISEFGIPRFTEHQIAKRIGIRKTNSKSYPDQAKPPFV